MKPDSSAAENVRPSPGRPRDSALDAQLLRAAIELFLEHGLEGANFDQISKRTGVARATIYRRWRSREALLTAALQSLRDSEAQNPAVIADMAPDQLLLYLANMLTDFLMKPEARILLARLIGTLPTHPALMATYRERFAEPVWQAIFTALERGRASGALSGAPPREMFRSLLLGPVYYRSVMRTETPKRAQERRWVEDLMARLGLPVPSASSGQRPDSRLK
jgi:AcrR family transcriptional regulator